MGIRKRQSAECCANHHDLSRPQSGRTYNGTLWSEIWNISKGPVTPGPQETPPVPLRSDMHALMYGNGIGTLLTTTIVELQSWFCDPNAPYDPGYNGCPSSSGTWVPPFQNPSNQTIYDYTSHAGIGYTAWNRPTMDARAVDIWDSGGNAVAMDWSGGQNDCPTAATNNSPTYPLSSYVQDCGNHRYYDQSYQDMVNSIQVTLPSKRLGANMKFFLILDRSAWGFSSICAANLPTYDGHDEPWCALNKMIADLKYSLTGQNGGGQGSFIPYLNQTNYFTVGGRPVIAIFQNEYQGGDFVQCNTIHCVYDDAGDTCTSAAACYSGMYQKLRAWLDNSSGLGANHYYLVFAYEAGCPGGSQSHVYSDGCYAWLQPHGNNYNPANVTVNNQRFDDPTTGNTSPKTSLDNFYSNSLSLSSTGANGQPPLVIGAAFKGFDDYMASWWADRVLSQECGQTWLGSWEEMTWNGSGYGGSNAYYSPSHPLKYMMVETWDDYEEGTEIETGISNCVNESTFTLSLNSQTKVLQWSFNFSDSSWGTMSSIDHYVLYYSTDGINYFVKDNNISTALPVCTFNSSRNPQELCTINLGNYTWSHGNYTLYVQAAAKPAMTNNLSNNSVTFTF